MLVNKKQQWDIYEQQEAPPAKKCLPKLDIALRIKCLISVVMVAVVAIFVTVRSEAIIRSGYDLVQMKSQTVKLEKENELLRLDIANLRSPQRIQHIATTELGMVMPQNVYCATSSYENEKPNTEKGKNLVSKVFSSLKDGNATGSKAQ